MGEYSVYKHVSPNGKVYIGMSKEPRKRWGRGGNYSRGTSFRDDIEKYGWDNIKHEIIYSDLTLEEAELKEREQIALYHSNDIRYGYNLTDGGEKGKHQHPLSIEKMRKAAEGKYVGEKNPNYGKPMSDEQKKLISESRIGKHYPKLSESVKKSEACIAVHESQKKAIIQYTKEGEFIKEWKSAPDASLYLIGHTRGQSNICSCANGKLETAYGYKWEYTNVNEEVMT